MHRLGMGLRAIGAALGVDETTVLKALAGLASLTRKQAEREGERCWRCERAGRRF